MPSAHCTVAAVLMTPTLFCTPACPPNPLRIDASPGPHRACRFPLLTGPRSPPPQMFLSGDLGSCEGLPPALPSSPSAGERRSGLPFTIVVFTITYLFQDIFFLSAE